MAAPDLDELLRGARRVEQPPAFADWNDPVFGTVEKEHRRLDAIHFGHRVKRIPHDQPNGEEGILRLTESHERCRRTLEDHRRLWNVRGEIDRDRRAKGPAVNRDAL